MKPALAANILVLLNHSTFSMAPKNWVGMTGDLPRGS